LGILNGDSEGDFKWDYNRDSKWGLSYGVFVRDMKGICFGSFYGDVKLGI